MAASNKEVSIFTDELNYTIYLLTIIADQIHDFWDIDRASDAMKAIGLIGGGCNEEDEDDCEEEDGLNKESFQEKLNELFKSINNEIRSKDEIDNINNIRNIDITYISIQLNLLPILDEQIKQSIISSLFTDDYIYNINDYFQLNNMIDIMINQYINPMTISISQQIEKEETNLLLYVKSITQVLSIIINIILYFFPFTDMEMALSGGLDGEGLGDLFIFMKISTLIANVYIRSFEQGGSNTSYPFFIQYYILNDISNIMNTISNTNVEQLYRYIQSEELNQSLIDNPELYQLIQQFNNENIYQELNILVSNINNFDNIDDYSEFTNELQQQPSEPEPYITPTNFVDTNEVMEYYGGVGSKTLSRLGRGINAIKPYVSYVKKFVLHPTGPRKKKNNAKTYWKKYLNIIKSTTSYLLDKFCIGNNVSIINHPLIIELETIISKYKLGHKINGDTINIQKAASDFEKKILEVISKYINSNPENGIVTESTLPIQSLPIPQPFNNCVILNNAAPLNKIENTGIINPVNDTAAMNTTKSDTGQTMVSPGQANTLCQVASIVDPQGLFGSNGCNFNKPQTNNPFGTISNTHNMMNRIIEKTIDNNVTMSIKKCNNENLLNVNNHLIDTGNSYDCQIQYEINSLNTGIQPIQGTKQYIDFKTGLSGWEVVKEVIEYLQRIKNLPNNQMPVIYNASDQICSEIISIYMFKSFGDISQELLATMWPQLDINQPKYDWFGNSIQIDQSVPRMCCFLANDQLSAARYMLTKAFFYTQQCQKKSKISIKYKQRCRDQNGLGGLLTQNRIVLYQTPNTASGGSKKKLKKTMKKKKMKKKSKKKKNSKKKSKKKKNQKK